MKISKKKRNFIFQITNQIFIFSFSFEEVDLGTPISSSNRMTSDNITSSDRMAGVSSTNGAGRVYFRIRRPFETAALTM